MSDGVFAGEKVSRLVVEVIDVDLRASAFSANHGGHISRWSNVPFRNHNVLS